MAHSLIIGMTETGKTTLAYKMANAYGEQGTPVFVLDVFCSPKWNADYITTDATEFCEVVKQNESCALFIDESGEKIGRYAKEMLFLGTSSRHWGHNAHFICQRASMIDRNIRDQCLNLFVFRQPLKEAKLMADDFGIPELLECAKLQRGEYLFKTGFDNIIGRGNAFE